MKKGILTSLGLAAVLTLGLASMTVNEYRNFKEVYAEDYTASVTIADYASSNNWNNDTNYNIVILDDNATVTTSGTDNAYSKYFTSGTNWRIYQAKSPEIVVSVAEGCELKSVKFTYTANNNGVITFGGNNVSSGTLVEVSGSSATFGVGNTGTATNGQARITKIEVSYTSNNAPVDKTDEVVSLFKTYYHDGDYTKDSVLNTSKIANQEVAKYFHASADTKYRKTVYTPTGLTMTTSTDGEKYENESKYENGEGNVVHTGFGGNWTVNKPSVEDWFVTLKDFVDNPGASWTYENGVYSHDLVPATATEEDELTRMAREFVAPMWLAPNKDNYTYAPFTKLTVEEDNNTLVMKLYVDEEDSTKLEPESNNVFSKVTISKGSESLSTLAVFELGTNGSATHNDGSEASSPLEFTEGANKLSLTGISKVWKNAIDAKGNSCLKLGTSKAVGSFQFTVPNNVNKVIINVAGYKGDTVKITVNGVSHTINTLSNNGEYTSITVDTSTTKTVNFATTSTGYRCMINSIEYHK